MALDLVQWGVCVFHITHAKNLPGILKRGLLSKNHAKGASLKYTSIADEGIQQRRSELTVPIALDGATVHDYVPCFFGARPPMLYAVKYRHDQDEILYVGIKWCILDLPDTIFTDGNAATQGTSFFSGVAKLGEVDQAAARATQWNTPPELRRKKQAEVLVRNRVPPEYVGWVVARTGMAAAAADRVISSQNASVKVYVAPEYYYR